MGSRRDPDGCADVARTGVPGPGRHSASENTAIKALRAKATGLDLRAPSAEGMTRPPEAERRQLLVSDLVYQIMGA